MQCQSTLHDGGQPPAWAIREIDAIYRKILWVGKETYSRQMFGGLEDCLRADRAGGARHYQSATSWACLANLLAMVAQDRQRQGLELSASEHG